MTLRLSRADVRGLVAPKRREKDVQAAILSALRARGIACWKVGTGTFRSTYKGRERWVQMGQKGMADIIGVLPWTDNGHRPFVGRFLAIEVKTETGTVTPTQQAFLDSVQNAGGLAFVARSVDDVVKALGWDARSK